MRRGTWIVSFAVLVACTFGVVSLAPAGEEEEGKLYFIEEVTVKPEGVAAYEAAVKSFSSIMAEHGFSYAYEAYATDDYHYYYVYPIKDFADVDALYKSWMKLLESWGWDKYEEMEKQISGSYETYRFMLSRLWPNLSYTPEQNPYDRDKSNYLLWGYCYVKPGKEKAFEKNFKDFVTLFTAKEVPFGWQTWQGDFGTEMPVYIYVEQASSPAVFWTEVENAMKMAGDETGALWNETLSLLRRYDVKTGTNRPELSYRPVKPAANPE